MNKQLQDVARTYIKEGLLLCTQEQQLLFKRMYAHGNLEKDIKAVVNDMPEDKLDWAMEQVRRTLEKMDKQLGINTVIARKVMKD
jgi:hypothetical protein